MTKPDPEWDQFSKDMKAMTNPSSEVTAVVKEWDRVMAEFRAGNCTEVRLIEQAICMRAALTEQAKELAKAKTKFELMSRSADRHRVCSDHNGKQPTDGECIMCFAERHERGRNQHEAEFRAEVERLTGELTEANKEILIQAEQLASYASGNRRDAEHVICCDDQRKAAEARATTAEAALETARGALEPFEEIDGEGEDDYPDSTGVVVQIGRSTYRALTLGDFRRARLAALPSPTPAQKGETK